MDETISPLALGVIAGAMLLSLAALFAAAVRAFSGRHLILYEPHPPVPWTGWDVSWILLYVALNLLAGAADVIAGAPAEPPPSPAGFLGMLAFLAALNAGIIALSLLCARLRTKVTLRDLGLRRDTLLGDVRLGVAAFLVVLAPVYLVQAIVWYGFDVRQPHALLEMVAADPRLFWACAVSAVIVAPITEELMFRVLLQGWLERLEMLPGRAVAPDFAAPPPEATAGFASTAGETQSSSPADVRPGPVSLFLPALLFALVHGWPDCLPLFVFALALGYLYRQTHRVVPCIVLHMCLNGGSMFLLWLSLP